MTTGPDDLAGSILGELPALTGEDVAHAAGLDISDVVRMWRALGFADAGDTRAFTESDVAAVSEVYTLAAEAGLDTDVAVRLIRGLGQLMGRLADWEVAVLTEFVEERETGRAGRLALAMGLVDTVAPRFETLMIHAWRRHLAAALTRVQALGSSQDELHLTAATVGFADLVSFSALSNELEDHQIGDLVEVFEARVHDAIARRGGRAIKSLGDSVLFIATSASEGVEIATDILHVVGGDARLPDVRVGLATGPVVLRLGDVYGPAVNLAARLTSVARRNRVIVDEATAGDLSPKEYDIRRLPARPLRGFGDVEPVAVRRHRAR